MKGRGEALVIIAVLAGVAGLFCVLAVGLPATARLVPLVAGVPALVLLVLQLVIEIKTRPAQDRKPVSMYVMLPAMALLAGIYLVGFAVAVPLFAGIEWRRTGAAWPAALGVGAALFAVVLGMFSLVPGIRPYGGWIGQWLF